jgi:hypothetical protein
MIIFVFQRYEYPDLNTAFLVPIKICKDPPYLMKNTGSNHWPEPVEVVNCQVSIILFFE